MLRETTFPSVVASNTSWSALSSNTVYRLQQYDLVLLNFGYHCCYSTNICWAVPWIASITSQQLRWMTLTRLLGSYLYRHFALLFCFQTSWVLSVPVPLIECDHLHELIKGLCIRWRAQHGFCYRHVSGGVPGSDFGIPALHGAWFVVHVSSKYFVEMCFVAIWNFVWLEHILAYIKIWISTYRYIQSIYLYY